MIRPRSRLSKLLLRLDLTECPLSQLLFPFTHILLILNSVSLVRSFHLLRKRRRTLSQYSPYLDQVAIEPQAVIVQVLVQRLQERLVAKRYTVLRLSLAFQKVCRLDDLVLLAVQAFSLRRLVGLNQTALQADLMLHRQVLDLLLQLLHPGDARGLLTLLQNRVSLPP